MTGAELAEARKTLGWSDAKLAKLLACSRGVIRQMENGKQHVREEIATWIRGWTRYARLHPPPVIEWRRTQKGESR